MTVPGANPYAVAVETEIMCLAVSEVISAIVAASGLREHEVLDILEHLGADAFNDMRAAMAKLGTFEPVAQIGAESLAAIFTDAIADIAALAEIAPDELAQVVMHESGGSLAGILGWLRASGGTLSRGAAAGY